MPSARRRKTSCLQSRARTGPPSAAGDVAKKADRPRTAVGLSFEMEPWPMKKPVIASVQGHVLGRG